jgi:hypothetical protein
MAGKIQSVGIGTYINSIYCMFCGKEVIGDPESRKPKDMVSPCSHTLFVATDEGFEYRSPRFNLDTGLEENDVDAWPDLGDHSYDSFTDLVNIENSIKLTMDDYNIGAYVGFAPTKK